MIDEDLDRILERMARDEGTSKAALIRRFVRQRVRPLPAMHDDPIWGLAGIADVEVEPGESVDDVVYP
ncbi:MAG: CopG family transcriptional regulator [Actinomycetota bacterium]